MIVKRMTTQFYTYWRTNYCDSVPRRGDQFSSQAARGEKEKHNIRYIHNFKLDDKIFIKIWRF